MTKHSEISVRCHGLSIWLLLSLLAASAASAQSLAVSPKLLVFSAIAGRGNPAPQAVTLGGGAGTYQVTGQLAGWLVVTPRNGDTPGSLSVAVNAAGLRAGMYQDTIVVSSSTTSDTVPVVFAIMPSPPGAGQLAGYDVELTFTGYTGLAEGAPACKVNTQGHDRLIGTVIGYETTGGDDDVVYRGFLRRETLIDFCESRQKATADQRAWCEFTLQGSGVVDIELTAAFDSLGGAWLKAKPVNGPMTRAIVPGSDTCDPPEVSAALNAYQTSSDLGAASPNGQQIDDLKGVDANGRPQTFSAQGATRLRVGTYPPAQPDGWTLRVLRKLF